LRAEHSRHRNNVRMKGSATLRLTIRLVERKLLKERALEDLEDLNSFKSNAQKRVQASGFSLRVTGHDLQGRSGEENARIWL
jgi:hypothetical protein